MSKSVVKNPSLAKAKRGRPPMCEQVKTAQRVLGTRLKAIRHLTGLNRVEFAKRIRSDGNLEVQLDPEVLKGWEAGKATPSGYYLGEWIRVLEETKKMAPGGLPWSFAISMALRLESNEWFWQRFKHENDEELRLRSLRLAITRLLEGKDLEAQLQTVISVLSDNRHSVERALTSILQANAEPEPSDESEDILNPEDIIGPDDFVDWEPPPEFTSFQGAHLK